MNARTQTTIAFLVSGMMLAFATVFIMIDELRPFLEGASASDPAWREQVAGIYPFAAVTEVRMGYAALNLIPLLLPVLCAYRWAARTTLVTGALLGLSNLSDGVADFLLGGRPVLGAAYLLAVGLPALVAVICAWRWARETTVMSVPA